MMTRNILLLFLLVLACLTQVRAQSGNVFTSYSGGFTINLPPGTNGLNGMGSGFRFTWRQAEIKYEIGFHERQGLPLGVVDGEFSIDEVVRKYFNKFSASGKQVYRKEISLAGKPGYEYKYAQNGSIFLLRLFLVGDRLYQLQAEIPSKNQSQEPKVLEIFDSFRLLAPDVIKAAKARKIAEATPADLPQTPVAAKAKSDVQDRNLKGKVRSVLNESARFALNDSLLQKKSRLFEEFAAAGNLIKSVEYDNYGEAADIRVFGFVAGKRVARKGSIEREYNAPAIMLNIPLPGKPDNRFDESYGYKYLGGNLVEETISLSNGFLISRAKHVYLKNRKETSYYGGNTKPYRKVVYDLDEKGNEVKIRIVDPEDRSFNAGEPYVIKYDSFDEQGNWTQRTVSRFYGLEGQGKLFAEYIEYRTILYY